MSNAKQHAAKIVRTLREHGYQAYFAGGCVRDLLLGREPADFDVATDATPQQVMQIFPQTFAVGEQFGVVLVPEHILTGEDARRSIAEKGKGAVVEVTTFRSDVGYSDGRHPDEVRFSKDPREDVQRRDFTINGMMLDPMMLDSMVFDKTTNEILDFVGGREDLKAGIVRAIGEPERRFAEDKLRMLRAVRFAARFDYRIDPATLAAIQKLATRIHQVSCERVREELTKMLTEGHARRAFELLDTTGLLPEVLPEVAAMKGVEQPPEYHPEGDVFVHTLLLLEKLQAGGSVSASVSKTLAWGALLHDVGKPPTFRRAPDRIRFDGHVEVGVAMGAEICRRFRFSNEETRQVLALIENHMRFMDAQRMKESTLKRFFRLERFEEHLALHRMDCLAGSGYLEHWEFVRDRWQATPEEAVRPQPLITGRELIAAGYAPGARFREMLQAAEDAQLEGAVATAEEALQLVRKRFPLESGEQRQSNS